MSGISFPSVSAEIKPYLQVAVDLKLAGSSDGTGVAAAGASLAPALEAAALVQALPNPATGDAQSIGAIINTYA
jgi:hypothetical protein